MQSFIITGVVTKSLRTLAANESGFVVFGASLNNGAGNAVEITRPASGISNLTVMGSIAATGGSAVMSSGTTPALQVALLVGEKGSLVSVSQTAARLHVGSTAIITNAGLIAGRSGIFVKGAAGRQTANITNSGTMMGNGLGAFNAIQTDSTLERAFITNAGTIQWRGTTPAITPVSTGAHEIANAGTILGQAAAIRSFGTLSLDNTGTVQGRLSFALAATLRNTGVIAGDLVDIHTGGEGDDLLEGGTGNDVLFGSTGIDRLTGGAGRDTMFGGAVADVFVFLALCDSTVANPDLIGDFGPARHRIDPSAIDADPVAAGNQGFAFIGNAACAGSGPQMRFVQDAAAGITPVQARLAGSVTPDMAIALTGLQTLTEANAVI